MQPKVLNLIQKFENLSNEISKPRRFPVTRQKSVPAPVTVKQEEPPRPQTPQPTPIRTAAAAGGWQNKPIVDIEEGLKAFKKKMDSLDPTDEKSVLAMFMDILDLLIKLSSIDTDGLKAMKVKKENCLLELKNIKTELTDLVLNNKPVEHEKQPEDDYIVQSPVVINTTVEVKQEDKFEKEEEKKEELDKFDKFDELGMKRGSVQSITKRFEMIRSQTPEAIPQSVTRNSSTNLYQMTDHSEEDSGTESDSSQRTSVPKMSLPELNSELEYFQEIVPSLDADDFVKLESVEEQLEMLLASARVHNCAKSQTEIVDLLSHVKALQNDEVPEVARSQIVIPEVTITTEEEETTTSKSLIEQQALCADFIEAERNNVFIRFEHAQQMSPKQHVNNPNYPTVQVVDINIPGDDHLTESYVILNTYNDILKEYLQAPKERLMSMEGAILKNYNILNAFKAHPEVESQFEDLRGSYKVILDFITEESFSQLYDENSVEEVDGEPYNITNFHNLCAEIPNYYPFIEKISVEEKMQVQVLKENLMDLAADIRKFDVSFNEDLKIKQADALQELDKLLQKVGS